MRKSAEYIRKNSSGVIISTYGDDPFVLVEGPYNEVFAHLGIIIETVAEETGVPVHELLDSIGKAYDAQGVDGHVH